MHWTLTVSLLKRLSPSGFTRRLVALSLSALFAYFCLPPAAHAEDKDKKAKEAEDAEVDLVSLAARLIHDGHHGRALSVLSEVKTDDPALDKKRFFTLRALAHLHEKLYEPARADFAAAIANGQSDPDLQLHLAQTCFALEDHACTLEALKAAGKHATERAAGLLMKAEAEWKLDNKAAAIATLKQGASRFPDQGEFERVQIFHLIDLGLYLEASAVATHYLERSGILADDYVAIGKALRAAKDYKRAQMILEGARLRFPEHEKVLVQLAHAYLDAGSTLTAAMLFEQAARLNPDYTLEAAEVYRQGGLFQRAMLINARVSDQKTKAKQRLSLLVDTQEFDSVTAMLPKLSRLGLLSDENIRYALGYAFFKTRRFDEAEQQLKKINDPQLFESANQLRKAMETCREAGWECTL